LAQDSRSLHAARFIIWIKIDGVGGTAQSPKRYLTLQPGKKNIK